MSEELKPCPFCGGEARLIHLNEFNKYVECVDCNAESALYDRRIQAIEAWNNRPIENKKDKEIERLKHKLNNIKDTLTKYHDVSLSKINAKEAESTHYFVFKFSSALLEIINDNK